jgi:hypothetical protein
MKTVRRIDRSLGLIHLDPQRLDGVLATVDESTGFLRVDARITRTGVFKYSDKDGNEWGELRTADQVFDSKAMSSFQLTPLTDDHPPEFVDHTNIRDVQVGSVGDIRRDGAFLLASIVVTDRATIQKIYDGKVELSCGYTAAVVMESGTTDDGVSFAARQTNIRGNHTALVLQGRAGSECALLVDRGDAFTTLQEVSPMKTRTIKIGDVEHVVPETVADAIEAERKVRDDAKKRADVENPFAKKEGKEEDEDEDEDEEKEGEGKDDKADLRAQLDKLQAKVDAREVDAKNEPSRIDARVELVADAREVLGADVATRGVNDTALQRQIVLTVRPSLKARLDANKSADYLLASYEDAMERFRTDQANSTELLTTLGAAQFGGKRDDDYSEMAKSIGEYHNGKAAE